MCGIGSLGGTGGLLESYIGGDVAEAFSKPFSSGQTNSKPSETKVGYATAHARGENRALASGPSDAACGIAAQLPSPWKDQP